MKNAESIIAAFNNCCLTYNVIKKYNNHWEYN